MSHGISSLLQALPSSLNVIQSFAEFEIFFRVSAPRKALRSVKNEPHLNVDMMTLNFYKKIGSEKMDFAFC